MRQGMAALFKGFALVFGMMSLACVAIGLGAQWDRDGPFDVLGVLPLLRNVGHLLAYFWAAIFAAAAGGCWMKVLKLST